MPTSFSRSLRSLQADRFRWSLLAVAVFISLLGLWLGWFFFARVALYEVSDEARLEVDREPHALMIPVSGRVIRNNMVLGKHVEKGELLLELDADEVRYQLEEKQAERAGLDAQLERLRRQIDAQDRALEQATVAGVAALDEARARYQEAVESASFAEQEAARMARLNEQGLISRAEAESATTEHRQKLKAAEALKRSIESTGSDREFDQSEKAAEVSSLEREAAELEAAVRRVQAGMNRLEYEVSLHVLRAPVAGRIGDRMSVRVGEVIEAGQHLGTVIPAGEVRVVAEFAPHRALGRIRAGQPSKLRLRGFSWVQYGSVPATVTQVGNEPQNGTVRVELSLDEPDRFPVSLTHGLPGTLQVEVEKISPVALVLRAAGDVVSRPVTPVTR